MELVPGLHRIGNDLVAAHLVETDEGITLIDAGLPGHHRDFVRELRAMGRAPSDLRGVVLTHGDSDHIGFAERVRTELGVPVFVGEADAARAMGEKPPATPKERMRIAPTLGFFAYAMRKGGLRSHPLGAVERMRDGDELALPAAPRILALPGHSPGSVAVHVPAVRAVFVGDALATRHVLTAQRGPQPAPFTDDQGEASASLDRIVDLDVDWVIPGHGPAFHGSAADAIAAYRAAERVTAR